MNSKIRRAMMNLLIAIQDETGTPVTVDPDLTDCKICDMVGIRQCKAGDDSSCSNVNLSDALSGIATVLESQGALKESVVEEIRLEQVATATAGPAKAGPDEGGMHR